MKKMTLQVCPGLLCEHVNCEEMLLFRLNIKGIVHPMIRYTDLGMSDKLCVSSNELNFFDYMHISVGQYSS